MRGWADTSAEPDVAGAFGTDTYAVSGLPLARLRTGSSVRDDDAPPLGKGAETATGTEPSEATDATAASISPALGLPLFFGGRLLGLFGGDSVCVGAGTGSGCLRGRPLGRLTTISGSCRSAWGISTTCSTSPSRSARPALRRPSRLPGVGTGTGTGSEFLRGRPRGRFTGVCVSGR